MASPRKTIMGASRFTAMSPAISHPGDAHAYPKQSPVKPAPSDVDDASTVSSAAPPRAGQGGGGGKGKKQEPCRVCGVIYEEMPRNCKECYQHMKDVAALQKWLEQQLAATPKDSQRKEDLLWFKNQKKVAGQPPSDFSKEVLTFAQNCPSAGQGVPRNTTQYSMFRQLEEQKASNVTQAGTLGVKMHKERFILWGKNNAFPGSYMDDWWESLKLQLDPKDPNQVDSLGPDFSTLQLACPIQNFTKGFAQQEHSKAMQLLSKNKKIGSAEELEQESKAVHKGLSSFSDGIFGKTGGGFMANVGKMGLTNVANSRGASSLTGAGGVQEAPKFGAEAVISKEEKVPKKKWYDVSKGIARVQEGIDTYMKSVDVQSKEILQKALASVQVAIDVEESIPTVARWKEILQRNILWLKLTMSLMDTTYSPQVPENDFDYSVLNAVLGVINTYVTTTSTGVPSPDNVVVAVEKLTEIAAQENVEQSWAMVFLSIHGWCATDFSFIDADHLTVSKDLQELLEIRSSCLALHEFKLRQAAMGAPRPIENADALQPLSLARFISMSARSCTTEHEVKELEASFNVAKDTHKLLF